MFFAAQQTTEDVFPTPLLLKPASAGGPYCVLVGAGPTDFGSDSGSIDVYASGIVTAGTFNPAASLAGATGSRDPKRLG